MGSFLKLQSAVIQAVRCGTDIQSKCGEWITDVGVKLRVKIGMQNLGRPTVKHFKSFMLGLHTFGFIVFFANFCFLFSHNFFDLAIISPNLYFGPDIRVQSNNHSFHKVTKTSTPL